MAHEPQPPSPPPAAASPGGPRLVQPIADVLANLEARIAFHRERESFHGEEAALHHAEQQHHAAQVEELTAHFAALQSAASAAVQLVQQAQPPAPLAARDLRSGRGPRVQQIVLRALEMQAPDEAFSPSSLTRVLNQLLRGTELKPMKPAQVSVALRRLTREGTLELVQAGRPHHEALYRRR